MPITAADINSVSFSIDRKGYNVDEVDVFLDRIAEEIDGFNKQIADLNAQLEEAREESAKASAQLAMQETTATYYEEPESEQGEALTDDVSELQQRVEELQRQLREKTANDSAISQALIVAQRSADEVVANAKTQANNIIKDADTEAERIVNKAESDRKKIIDAIRELENDRKDVRSEYRDMLSNFIEDANHKLSEIDADERRADANALDRSTINGANYGSLGIETEQRTSVPYTFPTDDNEQPPAAPAASGYIEKDFSGYGDAADDFSFDDVD